MKDQLHIMITGNEGCVRSLILSRKKIKASLIVSVLALCILCTATIFSSHFLKQSFQLAMENRQLSEELNEVYQASQEYAAQISELQALNVAQAEAFKSEKEDLLSGTVYQLNERSQLIEAVMSNIGVRLNNPEEDKANSGGPYLPPKDVAYNDLLNRSDQYLEAIRTTPLGWPHRGRITSKFGQRQDPLNELKGFHSGIDIRGKTGEKVYATADGRVSKAEHNGGYGLYVEIDHHNGYSTSFAHLKKYLVKQGDTVKRGQVIGLLGSTGRSTGPHLHYEIREHDKPINPYKFMRTLALAKTRKPLELMAKKGKKIYAPASTEN